MIVFHNALSVLIGLAVGSFILLLIGTHHVRRSGVMCIAGVPVDAGLGTLLLGLGLRFGTPLLVAGSLVLGSYIYAVVTSFADRQFDRIGKMIVDVVHELDPTNEGARFTTVLSDRRLRWAATFPNLFDFIMHRLLGNARRAPLLTMWTAPEYPAVDEEDARETSADQPEELPEPVEPPTVVMIALSTGEHAYRRMIAEPSVVDVIPSSTDSDDPIEVGPDHPAWTSIDDDDWNGSTYVMWLATLKGKKVILRPPPNPREGLVQDMIANLQVGGVDWDLPA